jgi:hypothetical protein
MAAGGGDYATENLLTAGFSRRGGLSAADCAQITAHPPPPACATGDTVMTRRRRRPPGARGTIDR